MAQWWAPPDPPRPSRVRRHRRRIWTVMWVGLAVCVGIIVAAVAALSTIP